MKRTEVQVESYKQSMAYRASCTHRRSGGAVYDNKTGAEVFNGKSKTSAGINKAKKHVRDNNFRSFNG